MAGIVNKMPTMKIIYFEKFSGISYSVRKMISTNSGKGALQKVKEEGPANTNKFHQDWKEENNYDVLFHDAGDSGLITLNRPHAMNALKVPMCTRMIQTLMDWESFKKRVIIEGAGDKAFCAGGDLKLLQYAAYPDVDFRKRHYFGTLYTLFHAVRTYKVPFIAVMNNITMGNGSGLSLHAKYRVVTERSVFAMPEASLGFYPDGGSSFVFPRLPGQLGLFIGLTGYRLKGIDILLSGIATHYVPAAKLPDLKQDLLTSKSKNIDEIIRNYQPENLPNEFVLTPYMERINEYFSAPSVEEIVIRLEKDGSEWAKKILKTMSKMSPTSLKVAHVVYQKGKSLSFTECIKMEFRVSCSFVTPNSDFCKAALALADKSIKVTWHPAHLQDVKMEDILQRFEPLHPDKELQL